MIDNRKIFIAFFMAVILCLVGTRPGFAAEPCKIISPKRYATLHSFPVLLAV